jgi:hypothetical protein
MRTGCDAIFHAETLYGAWCMHPPAKAITCLCLLQVQASSSFSTLPKPSMASVGVATRVTTRGVLNGPASLSRQSLPPLVQQALLPGACYRQQRLTLCSAAASADAAEETFTYQAEVRCPVLTCS